MFLSRLKVNVIQIQQTDRRKTGALHELWSQLINLHWRMVSKKINKHTKDKTERRKKRGRVGEKMDRQHPRLKGCHVWLLQAAHAGTTAATGCLLIYLGPLGLRRRGVLQIHATFSSWYGHHIDTLTIVLCVLQHTQFILTFNRSIVRNIYNCCKRMKLAQHL